MLPIQFLIYKTTPLWNGLTLQNKVERNLHSQALVIILHYMLYRSGNERTEGCKTPLCAKWDFIGFPSICYDVEKIGLRCDTWWDLHIPREYAAATLNNHQENLILDIPLHESRPSRRALQFLAGGRSLGKNPYNAPEPACKRESIFSFDPR